ncbi:MAG: hypothetical protein C4334_08645 [Pyrinomonas sp.]|uniref:hypothetical protein n=1 Tax=Pyrinomonas sp. TaxID=2080306 RepID=UPI00332E54DC
MQTGSGWKRVALYAAALLAAFLLGFVPMWLSARECDRQLGETQKRLRLATMQNELGSAVVDARRGEYEQARRAASNFFTAVRDEMDRKQDTAFSEAQAEALRPVLAQRDEIITLLARSDPAAADRLTELFLAFRNALPTTMR